MELVGSCGKYHQEEVYGPRLQHNLERQRMIISFKDLITCLQRQEHLVLPDRDSRDQIMMMMMIVVVSVINNNNNNC